MESQFTNQQNDAQQSGGYYYYTAPQPTVENAYDPANRRYGLGRAITAQILASVSIFAGIIAMYVIVFSLIGFELEKDFGASVLSMGFFFSVGCIAMSVVALVLGIKSIKCFKQRTPRPIATLILGISSVVEASSGIIVAFYDLFFILIALLVASVA